MAKERTSPLDPRRMMEKAIDVMRQSVPEHRPDASPSPAVGAVLVRPDGSIETAARGELREGNHAEFILLERKCAGERLDGCILFTTLEPCLNRNDRKRGCARHILSARIRTGNRSRGHAARTRFFRSACTGSSAGAASPRSAASQAWVT